MMIPEKMKAIVAPEPGGPEQLQFTELPVPQPAADELLVKVQATALNRADILQRQGKYPPPKGASPVLGLEIAGVVEQVGHNCSGWRRGDRVCALLPGGGYARYAIVPAGMAIPIPDSLSPEEAAAAPEVFLTAYQTLYQLGRIRNGDVVLIHAGASGVGAAAIQLVRFAGATSIITAGTAKKLDFCLKLGAGVAINYRDGEFASHVLKATNNNGVQIILDCVGAAFWGQNMQCLAMDGRLILIAVMSGYKVSEANLATILRKRLSIIGSTLRGRSPEYKQNLTREFVKDILPGFQDGRLKPTIDSVFSWKEVAEAHRRMENRENMGKIVLTID